MENKKVTKRENFEAIRKVLANIELEENLANQFNEFIDHEIELLDKKATSRGTSKTNQANENLKTTIVEALKEIARPVTITELQKENSEMSEYSNQKLSALLKQLVDNGIVTKTIDKKKSYFSVEVV